MRFDGEWLDCDDGEVRPVLHGDIEGAGGAWWPITMLVDSGADRTALYAGDLVQLNLPTAVAAERLIGVGGAVHSVIVQTRLRFQRQDGVKVTFRAEFRAFPDPESADMSVLGRDILNLFALIADHPGKVVTLLRDNHRYRIEPGAERDP